MEIESIYPNFWEWLTGNFCSISFFLEFSVGWLSCCQIPSESLEQWVKLRFFIVTFLARCLDTCRWKFSVRVLVTACMR